MIENTSSPPPSRGRKNELIAANGEGKRNHKKGFGSLVASRLPMDIDWNAQCLFAKKSYKNRKCILPMHAVVSVAYIILQNLSYLNVDAEQKAISIRCVYSSVHSLI